MADQIYCIDTSSLIDLNRRHPKDIFPGLWERLGELAQKGRLVAPREVFRELERGDDELVPWAREHIDMFQDLDEAQLEAVREILEQFPSFVDPDKETPEADPFVVAFAVVRNRVQSQSMFPRPYVVVAEERGRRSSEQRPRIPDVCQHLGVSCLRTFELMRAEGWTFR